MTSEPGILRVLIVDDHELIREGLAGAFSREEATEVITAFFKEILESGK